MKKIILSIGLLLCGFVHANQWHYVDYDSSMNVQKYGFVLKPGAQIDMKNITGISNAEFNTFFKELYDQNDFRHITPGKELKTPKIIHQIWLGGAVPEAFKKYMQSWQDMHPDWEYCLWTDDNVHEVKLYNQEYYDASPGNYGVQSDLLKWELVYQFGGVYVDVDFECLQPLDEFHYAYDFYTGIQPLDTRYVQLGAALFGAAPGNPILKHCIETIHEDWHHEVTVIKTGPVHFSKSFYKMAGKDGAIDVAMPAHYFYPLGSTEKELKREEWIEQGAYAVHHWAKSWVNPLFRPKEFRVLSEDEQWMAAGFDDLMRTSWFPYVLFSKDVKRELGVSGQDFLKMCKEIYEQKNLSKASILFYKIKTPKIIHQIWLDGPIPADVQYNMQIWKEKHGGWEYRLWTEKEISELNMFNKPMYDIAWTKEQKINIVRYELLDQFGGVVVDPRMQCTKDLTLLHHGYDFYAGLLPLDTWKVRLGNAIIGAKPGHPIIKQCMLTIDRAMYVRSSDDQTGEVHFSKTFMEEAADNDTAAIALPSTYFYSQSEGRPESFAMMHN